MTSEFFILDPSLPNQRLAYEHAFYEAYAKLTDNLLVRDLWQWDDAEKRLQTRISYEDQIIFGWQNAHGELLSALAVSVNPGVFQAGKFGFQRDNNLDNSRSCEILNLITTPNYGRSAVRGFYKFVAGYGFRSLVNQGYDIGYSTCTQRRKRGYVFLGGKVLDHTSINNESRYLITWDFDEILNQPPRR